MNGTAGNITAIASVITALGLLVTALTLFIPMLHQLREVHTIVNQKSTDSDNYKAALVREIISLGGTVPIDQSLSMPPPTALHEKKEA